LAEEAVDELSRQLSGLLKQMATDIVTGLDEGARISRTVADAALVGGGPLRDAEIHQRLFIGTARAGGRDLMPAGRRECAAPRFAAGEPG